jgi:hypothetical protein
MGQEATMSTGRRLLRDIFMPGFKLSQSLKSWSNERLLQQPRESYFERFSSKHPKFSKSQSPKVTSGCHVSSGPTNPQVLFKSTHGNYPLSTHNIYFRLQHHSGPIPLWGFFMIHNLELSNLFPLDFPICKTPK